MKLNISSNQNAELTLQCALLIYASENNTAIYRAEVQTRGGVASLNNPEQITEGLYEELLMMRGDTALQLIDPRVVAMTPTACAWFIAATPRRMRFNAQSDKTLNALSGEVFPQPPLLMITRRGQLRVYALGENVRPNASTPLMNPPYWNMMQGSVNRVCMGSSNQPDGSGCSDMSAWEESFFGSNFTHNGDATTRWTHQLTHLELWQSALERQVFDPAWLIPSGLTLQEAVCER